MFVQAGQFAFKRHVGKVVGIPDKPLKLDQNPLSYILIRVGKSSSTSAAEVELIHLPLEFQLFSHLFNWYALL